MSWITRIDAMYAEQPEFEDYRLRPEYCEPATEEELAGLQESLGCVLPESLSALLRETGGIMGMMSFREGDWFEENWLIWPVEKIVQDNLYLRTEWPEDQLERYLFFSSPGVDGIMCGFPAGQTAAADQPVHAWYPIGNEDKRLSDGLETYLRGTIIGGIFY